MPCFTVKWLVWLILDLTYLFVLSMWCFPSKNICPKSRGSVLMNCWRSPLCWSPIFCKTYKFLCDMWCVIGEVWCVMFQTWFVVRSGLHESRKDQKLPISVISDLFNDILILIVGGSSMYTISCKAMYNKFDQIPKCSSTLSNN